MAKKEYIWEIGSLPPYIDNHTKIKHKLYSDYIVEYIKTLNKNVLIPRSNLVIVDAFAGGGLYIDKNKKEHQGSPIKILDAVKQGEVEVNQERKNKFTLDYQLFLLEKNKKNLEYLKHHLSHTQYEEFIGEKIFIKQGVFIDKCQEIIQNICEHFSCKTRVIFILDQYGYADVPFNVIKDIFTKLPNSEVILTLSVDDIIDYIPRKSIITHQESCNLFDTSMNLLKNTNKGINSVNTAFSSLGFDPELLSEIKKSGSKSRSFIQHHITERLVSQTQAKQYSPFFLNRENSHKSMWLIHLANHPEATNVMKSLYHKYGNESQTIVSHHGGAGLDMFGYNSKNDSSIDINHSIFDTTISNYNFDEIAKRNTHNKLLTDIPKNLHNVQISAHDFYSIHSNHTPANKEMTRLALEDLLKAQEISVIGRNPTKRIQDADIITLNNQRKIYFSKFIKK